MRVSEAERCEARRSYAGAVVRAVYLAVGCAKGSGKTTKCGDEGAVRDGGSLLYLTRGGVPAC